MHTDNFFTGSPCQYISEFMGSRKLKEIPRKHTKWSETYDLKFSQSTIYV